MTEQEIHIICKQYNITNYTINDDMSIDVNGNVYIGKQLDKLLLKFGKVSGYFYCANNKLITLEGCPIEVGDYFSCSNNRLISLEGCPIKVGGNFYCNFNTLVSLEGGPKFIDGDFYCLGNTIYEEFRDKFNLDYNLYLKYTQRQEVLKQLIND